MYDYFPLGFLLDGRGFGPWQDHPGGHHAPHNLKQVFRYGTYFSYVFLFFISYLFHVYFRFFMLSFIYHSVRKIHTSGETWTRSLVA